MQPQRTTMQLDLMKRKGYDLVMAKAKKFDFDETVSVADDEETLAAINEGIADSAAGRMFSTDEVRKLLPKWISDSKRGKRTP